MKGLLLLALLGCGHSDPPRGRVVRIQAPHTAEEARAAGCWTDGEAIGPSLGRIAAEAGGFESYLESQGAPIRWVLIFEAPGIYGSARQLFTLHLRSGEQVGHDEFRIVDPKPTQSFRDIWLEEGGWISGESESIELPMLTDLPIVIENVSFNARLLQDDRGITIREGALSGEFDGETACLLIDVEPALIRGPEGID